MTADLKAMMLTAVVLGLATALVAAWLETLREEHMLAGCAYRPDEVPPADISALHEEVRRIQKDAGG